MGTYEWKQITADLKRYLHLMYTPVGMKWIATEEELNAIPKVRIHEKHYAPYFAHINFINSEFEEGRYV